MKTSLMACLILVVSFMTSAHADERESSSSVQDLKARVAERWLGFEKQDFISTYKFQTPAFKRAFSKELYANLFGMQLTWDFKGVDEIKFDKVSGVATVKVNIETSSVNPVFGSKKDTAFPEKVTEKWLHIDGQWWHSFDKLKSVLKK